MAGDIIRKLFTRRLKLCLFLAPLFTAAAAEAIADGIVLGVTAGLAIINGKH